MDPSRDLKHCFCSPGGFRVEHCAPLAHCPWAHCRAKGVGHRQPANTRRERRMTDRGVPILLLGAFEEPRSESINGNLVIAIVN